MIRRALNSNPSFPYKTQSIFLPNYLPLINSLWEDIGARIPKRFVRWLPFSFILYLPSTSLKLFRKPNFFHSYMVLAFISVVITYLRFNFFLEGMHSFA